MKKLLVIALTLMLVATGCGNGGRSSSEAAEPEVQPEVSAAEELPEQPLDEEQEPVGEGDVNDPLDGLVKDEYEGLNISATVLERKAILPGFSVPVTVKVQNTGDKTVAYTHGSGVFEVPDALVVRSENLQTVRTKDRMGMMTMDFVTRELAPGEELEYVVHVMTIQPNANFDQYSYDLYGEDETYIGDLEWPSLQERYSDLVAVEPGSYGVDVYFLYTVLDEAEESHDDGEYDADADGLVDMPQFDGPTGYAQTECLIGVSD